jgi:adenylate cyclase
MAVVWKIVGLVAGSAFIGVVYAFCLALIGLAPRIEPGGWDFFTIWIISVSVAAMAIGIPLVYWLVRPVAITLQQARSGTDPKASELAPGRKLVLNLPALLAVATILLWVVPLLSLPVAAAFAENAPDAMSLIIAMVSTTGIAVLHATFVIYLVEWFSRKNLMPVLFPLGQVSRIAGVRPVSVGTKLVLLFITTGLFPISAFIILVVAGTASVEAALFLGLASVILGFTQSALITSSIARPVKQLHGGMSLVREGNLSAWVPVESSDRLGQLTEGFNEMVRGLEEAVFVKETFGRYVSRPVLDEILAGNIQLGGERRTATVLISDLRNFTQMSEHFAPEHVVLFLNRYLDAMVDVLSTNGATIDKFIGDAIVAVFNVPVDQEDHAFRAVRAGTYMLKRLVDINLERRKAGDPLLDIGVGIHTGEVVAGNIGSTKKMEYTIIGDTVNTASRIEELNKRFNTRLLISEETYNLVADQVDARKMEPVEVKGKRRPIVVYEVTGFTSLNS